MKVLVTGGLGFIGSAVVRQLVGLADSSSDQAGFGDRKLSELSVCNVDVGTYAATKGSVAAVADSERYQHVALDITDGPALRSVMQDFEPDAIIHLAAESHVDRSIDGPGQFIQTNVVGTYELLQAALASASERGILDRFRFLHVSTDEVFGALALDGGQFDEHTAYDPRSPYSASKAASDHLVRAWHETYGLPTIITNCSNNYGPFHFPEKLIPLMIIKALHSEALPVYGQGNNVRDWLFVEDHATAIVSALMTGTPGETYLVGGNSERSNLEVVEAVCDLVDSQAGLSPEGPRRRLIEFVADRPGHDLRYAIDATKIRRELNWTPSVSFDEGLARTVAWYLENGWWWQPLVEDRYSGQRLGSPSDASSQVRP